jgi:hypothetical protein
MIDSSSTHNKNIRSRRGVIGGAILVLAGILSLLPSVQLYLAVLASAFVFSGLYFRKNGLVIPGGILAGLSVGVFLVEGPFHQITDPYRAGVILLALAGGFGLVSILSAVISALSGGNHPWMVWPLIPAGFMLLTDALLFTGNLSLLERIGQSWPILMIVIGIYLILRRRDLQA